MIERRAIGKTQVALLYTDLVGTSVQAEANAVSVKLSSYSLSALQSLLTASANSLQGRRPAPGELVLTEALLIETPSVTTAAISPPMVQISN
ncbi:hypothetical protein PsorP6_017844 [Peronosclerospora sorghi]|uniref:Uncharacterized protein n=1 Tax=Peronosclerospora sorghi TaxID=230839 RepID=A0ACC0WF58_9STRA|nr:hypothetical protein PsorP6_017844 [Peronosclerospora sorghi]